MKSLFILREDMMNTYFVRRKSGEVAILRDMDEEKVLQDEDIARCVFVSSKTLNMLINFLHTNIPIGIVGNSRIIKG